MKPPANGSTLDRTARTNGSGAAAILSAAIGCFALAILALAGDKSANIRNALIFYKPTGALSGVTDLAILLWLLLWVVMERKWARESVALKPVCIISFILLGLSFLLTFPPIVDIF